MTSAMTSSLRCRSHFASGYTPHLLTCLYVTYFIPYRLQNAQISFDNQAENVQGSEPIRAPRPICAHSTFSLMARAMVLWFQCMAQFPTRSHRWSWIIGEVSRFSTAVSSWGLQRVEKRGARKICRATPELT